MTDHVPAYLTTHTIEGNELVYGLEHEGQELLQAVQPGERKGKSLAKQPGLAVVLVAMGKGNKLGSHSTAGSTTVQVLQGSVMFNAGGDTSTLGKGQLVSLAPGATHDAEAQEPSVLLVTVAGPAS